MNERYNLIFICNQRYNFINSSLTAAGVYNAKIRERQLNID